MANRQMCRAVVCWAVSSAAGEKTRTLAWGALSGVACPSLVLTPLWFDLIRSVTIVEAATLRMLLEKALLPDPKLASACVCCSLLWTLPNFATAQAVLKELRALLHDKEFEQRAAKAAQDNSATRQGRACDSMCLAFLEVGGCLQENLAMTIEEGTHLC